MVVKEQRNLLVLSIMLEILQILLVDLVVEEQDGMMTLAEVVVLMETMVEMVILTVVQEVEVDMQLLVGIMYYLLVLVLAV